MHHACLEDVVVRASGQRFLPGNSSETDRRLIILECVQALLIFCFRELSYLSLQPILIASLEDQAASVSLMMKPTLREMGDLIKGTWLLIKMTVEIHTTF